MRLVVLVVAIAMPLVAWFSNQGAFGPTNAQMSDRYPTLLVAAGWAFSIWGPIFALDLLFAGWQRKDRGALVQRLRVPAAIGFALTAAWMPVFSQAWFGLALAIIWGALAALLYCAVIAARERAPWPTTVPLSLHAGWLTLAAFLNTAQVVVAYELLDSSRMVGWSALLLGLAGVLVMAAHRAMRGNPAYAAALLWGLAGVYARQSSSPLAGAGTVAWLAVALAVVLVLQSVWLFVHRNRV